MFTDSNGFYIFSFLFVIFLYLPIIIQMFINAPANLCHFSLICQLVQQRILKNLRILMSIGWNIITPHNNTNTDLAVAFQFLFERTPY